MMDTIFYLIGAGVIAYSIHLIFFTRSSVDILFEKARMLGGGLIETRVTARSLVKSFGGGIISILWMVVGIISTQWLYFLVYTLLAFIWERVSVRRILKDQQNITSMEDVRHHLSRLLRIIGISQLVFAVVILLNFTWLKIDLWGMLIKILIA